MANPKYRIITKVLCPTCESNRSLRKRIDTTCKECNFVKYTSREGLVKFTKFLNKTYPNWVWMNVFEYIKGENGRKLASYQKGKNEPSNEFI